MFPLKADLLRKFNKLPADIKEAFISFLEYLEFLSRNMVRREDFSELKDIIKQLAEAQSRTEERLEQLAEAQSRTEERLRELAEAQARTERRLEELAEVQARSEDEIKELRRAIVNLTEAQSRTEEEIRKLYGSLGDVRRDLGGLARSVSYALENEAYKKLPVFLKERYGIEVLEKIIRFEIDDEEINLFARGRKNGESIIIVGESVMKFTRLREIKPLERKIEKIKKLYKHDNVVGIIVTHFARKAAKEGASRKGFIVVQSFEW
ncbi:MAG: hypothetical protein J7M13_01630 [Synergistetes bacterium]|nr:hypothetical protein [Synergistota bacterium]